MIHELKKIETIISKIVRDLNLKDGQIDNDYFVEWIAEALRFLDAYDMFITKEEIIPITNYKGKLPCDYYKHCKIVNHYNILNEDFEILLYGFVTLQSINSRMNWYDSLNRNEQLGKYVNHNKQTNFDFRIEHRTVFASFKKGFIRVQYIAIPLDDKTGYPLVPDDVSVDTALFWYVAKFLALQNKLENKQLTFVFCDSQWKKYCLQARGTLNMPDVDLAEKLGYNYNMLVPRIHKYY